MADTDRLPLRPDGYERFFGLDESPFRLTSNPRFLFESASYLSAFTQIVYALTHQEQVIVVTGPIGTGKTTLCRMIAERNDPRTLVAVIGAPPHSVDDLYRQILDGFDHLPGRPRHVRRFVVSPAAASIEITDRIEGEMPHTATARLLLHPACTLDLEGPRAVVRQDDVVVDVVAEQPIRCEPAHWSPDMGLWLATRRLAIRFERAHRLVLRVRPRGRVA